VYGCFYLNINRKLGSTPKKGVLLLFENEQTKLTEVIIIMGRNKANHVRPGMNAAKSQGKGAGYETEFGNEALSLPNEKLSEAERQNNKKTKKRH
jgi:small acid-soluble spore protein O (minor)